MIPFLSLVPWRIWAGAGLALLLAGGLWWVHHDGYRKGWERGSAEIRSQWAADTDRREKARLRALAASEELLRRQREITQDVEQNLTARLAAADARGRDLAGRLRDALSAGTCPVSPAGIAAGAIDRAGGEPNDQATIGAALADHLAACERDAQRLTDLQGWVERVRNPTAAQP